MVSQEEFESCAARSERYHNSHCHITDVNRPQPKHQNKNTTTRRAPHNGTLFRIQKYQALKEIAPEPVIEKYSFNLQFESFMVSKCVNTATFSLAMTFCHQKKFINRQHLAQITFLPRPALIHSLGSACFLSQMICNSYLQSGEEIACYFKRPSTELTLD